MGLDRSYLTSRVLKSVAAGLSTINQSHRDSRQIIMHGGFLVEILPVFSYTVEERRNCRRAKYETEYTQRPDPKDMHGPSDQNINLYNKRTHDITKTAVGSAEKNEANSF